MEMESSRRPPLDRSREIAKKPRLSDESALPVGPGRQFRRPELGREAGDPARGGLQQHQELINQYKTALAELTFNSKPIITNLTIIAGENLQSAKAIASTICSNILEVPSEQKLPSLYLLDSIVKNIGGDYIKYFAARLPEVFCKAYRLVDSSTHPSMRHLFGTWKGVFPTQPLQIIDKELSLSAAVNRPSSGSAPSKSDSQSRRQSPSIHVNPKYLEARQCLHQSTRPNGKDIGGTSVKPSDDVERPDRTTTSVTGRPWVDSSLKIHNVQRPMREALREPNQHRHPSAEYGDYELTSGASRPLCSAVVESSGKLISGNGLDIKRGISSYTLVRPTSGNVPSLRSVARNSADMSRSWKNSEEEYMWDDLGSRVTNSATLSGTKRDVWSSVDMEKMDYNPQKLNSLHTKRQSPNETSSNFEKEPSADPLSFPHKDRETSTHSRLSHHNVEEPHQIDGSVPLLQQLGARSSLSKRDPRQNLVLKDHMRSHSFARSDPRAAPSLPGQSFTGFRDQITADAIHHENSQPDLHGKSDVSSLLASVMKSGVLSGSSASGEVTVSVKPPTTSLLTSKTCTGSESGIISPHPSHDSSTTSLTRIKVERPQLPHVPLPCSSPVSSISGQTSDVASTNSNPLSSLFTSLVAKGLISSSKNEAIEPIPVQSNKIQHKELSAPAAIPPCPKASSAKLSGERTVKISETCGRIAEAEIGNLIGVEFKPRFLREFNPSVIDGVLENLPYKCAVCGLQFKLLVRLEKHSEWHALKNSIPNSLNRPTRRWYSTSTDWVAGKAGFPFGYCSSILTKAPSDSVLDETMVPADESQCVCLLCGEVFEEVYCLEMDEWMFKGAVYMSIPSVNDDGVSSDERGMQNLIVHANCMTDDSAHELGLIGDVEEEKDV